MYSEEMFVRLLRVLLVSSLAVAVSILPTQYELRSTVDHVKSTSLFICSF